MPSGRSTYFLVFSFFVAYNITFGQSYHLDSTARDYISSTIEKITNKEEVEKVLARLRQFDHSKTSYEKVSVQLELATAYADVADMQNAKKYASKALMGSKKLKNKELMRKSYRQIISVNFFLSDLGELQKYSFEFLAFADKHEIDKDRAYSYHFISYVQLWQVDLDKTLKYSDSCLKFSLKSNDLETYRKGLSSRRLYWSPSIRHNADSCTYYYNKLKELMPSLSEKENLRFLMDEAQYFKERGELERAMSVVDEVFEQLDNPNLALNVLGYALWLKGEILIDLEAYAAATDYLKLSVEVNKKTQQWTQLWFNYYTLIKAVSHLNRPDLVLEYFEYSVTANDSIYAQQQASLLHEAEVKYQTERKEQEIAQKKRLISEQRASMYKVLIVLSVSLIMLVFAIWAYVQKRKSNQKLKLQKAIVEQSEKEKELLLREIHHRVKNNLQIVMGLMELQSYDANDEEVSKVLAEGQTRIKSIALIHQKLYQVDDLGHVDFKDYIQNLLGEIASVYKTVKRVDSTIECESIQFDIDTAIPLGLILNELVVNSYKYAAPVVESLNLKIKIERLNDSTFKLEYFDNGDGLPEQFDFKKTKTLGMRLVRRLSKQLLGKINFESDHKGFYLKLEFKESLVQKMID